MATMVATSFAPFAVLQDALITTHILCAPTNLTATALSPVLTCFPFNVAFVAEMVTLQVTASSSHSRDSHSVCPQFHNNHNNHNNNNTVHSPELCLKHHPPTSKKEKKKISKQHFLLSTAAAATDV